MDNREYNKERRLALYGIRTYCRMVIAIEIALAIQQEFDIVCADTENNLMLVSTSK